MAASILAIPPLAAGATPAKPNIDRPLAPKEPPYRDYLGYGDLNIPVVSWPGGKKIALCITIHFEEGAELTPENGDAYGETLWGEAERKVPRLGRDLAIESVYEYSTKRGYWRICDLLESLSFTFTLFAAGRAAELTPVVVEKAHSLGAEVCANSYRFANYDLIPEETELAHITHTLQLLKSLSPVKEYPAGFYVERPSISTQVLLKKAYKDLGAEYTYNPSAYGDDLPYYADGMLCVPHTLDCNDQKMVAAPGLTTPSDFLAHITDAFEVLLEEGEAGTPKMMSLAIHPRILGRPGRFVALKQFLEMVKSHEDKVWVCQKQDIAKHWLANHPNNA